MESQLPDDESLAARAEAGESEAFEDLIGRYEKPVFRMIYQFTNDRHQAEDLSQETFVKAYRSLEKFDPEKGRFSTWLFTIARNLCRNAWRSRSSDPVDCRREEDFIVVRNPEDEASAREVFNELNLALERLPEVFRSAFILGVIEQLPLAEVAEIEGVAEGTIKSRISRAREQLRTVFENTRSNP